MTWTPQAESLLGTDTDATIAHKLGRTVCAVRERRRKLGIKAHRQPFEWSVSRLRQLGKKPDAVLAAAWGCSRLTVWNMRQKLGIECACPEKRPGKTAVE